MRFMIISKKLLIAVCFILILLIIFSIYLTINNKSKEVFYEDIYYKGTKEEKIVAFVCNVDWGNEHINDMLRIFEENDIYISFFLTGRWAKENPDIVKQIHKYNHEIGNHGYNHIDYSQLSYEQNKEEISKANDVIEEIIGIRPNLFGPPSGAFNENTVKAAKDLGSKVIMWSVDTIDWREDSTKELIYKRVTSKIENSSIVLMHPTENTVKALPEIIKYLFENGYKIGTISDVI
ncbi:polysaccharide deacetylase family protein [Tissierella sp. Yu-01]|uniref:polysaccharide deacetylase family protein n=1 Tax=Tissierella sp. Yu-01 TaxID=3035694 RepID=UPI00240D30F7|nr:polysaccharide deacetylase family protein [Tissierella sp. Yu-01]WFA09755.1 polysaccharide deacetylase family protein [Tissierella sp. Yu-01]